MCPIVIFFEVMNLENLSINIYDFLTISYSFLKQMFTVCQVPFKHFIYNTFNLHNILDSYYYYYLHIIGVGNTA